MSATDFHFSLKGNADSIYTTLNKRKEFYITVQNLTDSYVPSVKVKLSGPPEVKLLGKMGFYGGISRRHSRNRLFTVLPKANGIFTLTATLTTKRGHHIELPITLQVGGVQEFARPISLVSTPAVPAVEKSAVKVNCPFCGDKIDEDAKFCPHCGSNLAEAQKEAVETQEEKNTTQCNNCGRELPSKAKFCAGCGQKV